MQIIIDKMKSTGYTEYESKAYIALIQQRDVTAYQISKKSGIPRARIYDVLNSLVAKGIVSKNESIDKTTYIPIPVDVFLRKLETKWRDDFSSLTASLEALEQAEVDNKPTVVMIEEAEMILSYCRTLIQSAKKKILVSLWDDMYDFIRDDLTKIGEKIAIHGITLHVVDPLPSIDLHRTTYFTERKTSNPWFIISIDSEKLIYGPSLQEREIAFYTDDPIHIRLLEDYIWHDVLVNRIVNRSDELLEDWVKEQRSAFFLDGR
ncbi:TrmB family transcriptional regulator [Kurthia sibirica]|uniref:TrmB family transcriptional regulator n=1 Tax=Kurthia sibirica TaxID=202750 RepID=A0A2U3ANA5_9BACL|nr:helix-turn-helix domain-containing protein [Kurthia sibirica]PWI26001.1 TrmB family transcriptional regulator [Kurthia sibirica]GEK35280.1 transcriptional regulator [Kurthia sibirica]